MYKRNQLYFQLKGFIILSLALWILIWPKPINRSWLNQVSTAKGKENGRSAQSCIKLALILTSDSLAAAAAAAKSLQSCPTLWDPIDGSPPGSSVPGILQTRILEWVAISFYNAWKWKVKMKSLSRVRLFVTPWMQPTRLLCPWEFPGKSTGVSFHCLLQEMLLGNKQNPVCTKTQGKEWWPPEGLMLKLKLQYFGHLNEEPTHGKTLMLGKIEGSRRRGWQRMASELDGITNSMDMSLFKLQEMMKGSLEYCSS